MKKIKEALTAKMEGIEKMKMRTLRFGLTLLGLILLLAGCVTAAVVASPQTPAQSTFASPEDAMQALASATNAKDRPTLAAIFGPDYDHLMSGDDVEDTNDLNEFAQAVSESIQLQKVDDSKYTMLVGHDNFPFPIPIVQKEGKWLFDTKSGLDEVLNRRIGENELSAINTCRAYAVAQWEYFTESDWDHDGVAEYAQKFMSSPGEHNGLYWETAEDEKPSPLGKLVADARTEGYGPNPGRGASNAAPNGPSQIESQTHPRIPFHGYYFKILKGQGPHAPGGKYGYVINGNMIAGYALVAYPDKWGNSGVMTFIINQQGRVYEKNLGADTIKIASSMTAYDPDSSWKLVEAQP